MRVLPESYTGIVSAESKGIAQSYLNFSLHGFVEGEIQLWINLRIQLKMVNGWWNDVVFQAEYGCNGFNSPCGAQQVACHRLGGINTDLVSMFPKQVYDGLGLSNVAQGG